MADRTWIDAFTDGRDVSPHAAVHDLATLPADRIASVAGRYYAMDRDKRWDRTELALAAIVAGHGAHAADPVAAVQASYDAGVTDEFVVPVVIDGRPRLDPARTPRSSSTSVPTGHGSCPRSSAGSAST